MMNKCHKYILSALLVFLIIVISYSLTLNNEIIKLEYFSINYICTYLGILIGLSLTIFTFSLSLFDEIKRGIEEKFLSDSEKINKYLAQLKSIYIEMKQDIWLIIISLLVSFLFDVLFKIQIPFINSFKKFNIQETINISSFILASLCMYDIIRTLFGLSKLKLEISSNKLTDL